MSDDAITLGTVLVARVPLYGSKDVGRGFCNKLRDAEIIWPCGCKTYCAQVVGDILWGSKPGYEYLVAGLLEKYKLQNVEMEVLSRCRERN